MATTLTLASPAGSRNISAANDTKAAEVLTRFARARGCPDDATTAQRADFILRELVEWMIRESRREYIAAAQTTLQNEAEANVGF